MPSLPPEVAASYSAIIDKILAESDINTISAKRIRKGLQEELDYDISHQKHEVTDLIMARFDKFNSERERASKPSPRDPIPTVENRNGHTHRASTSEENSTSVSKKRTSADSEESELSDLQDSPPKKKQKKRVKQEKQTSVEDEDAAYAAKLQAEFNAASRTRATRGGNTKKRAPTMKKKKKSANRVKNEDDSDVASGSGDEKKEVKRTGGFHKPLALSEPLSELLGETQLSRPQTVKKIWEYVKARDLQDPDDKRQIRCDDAMRAVFKQDRVHMFTMNKILGQHVRPIEE